MSLDETGDIVLSTTCTQCWSGFDNPQQLSCGHFLCTKHVVTPNITCPLCSAHVSVKKDPQLKALKAKISRRFSNQVVLLIGLPGAGKSTIGNLLTGQGAFGEPDLTQCVTSEGNELLVIDAPNLFSTDASRVNVSAVIETMKLISTIGLDAVILVVKLEDVEGGCLKKLLEKSGAIFGEAIMKQTCVVIVSNAGTAARPEEQGEWLAEYGRLFPDQNFVVTSEIPPENAENPEVETSTKTLLSVRSLLDKVPKNAGIFPKVIASVLMKHAREYQLNNIFIPQRLENDIKKSVWRQLGSWWENHKLLYKVGLGVGSVSVFMAICCSNSDCFKIVKGSVLEGAELWSLSWFLLDTNSFEVSPALLSLIYGD